MFFLLSELSCYTLKVEVKGSSEMFVPDLPNYTVLPPEDGNLHATVRKLTLIQANFHAIVTKI